MTAFELKRIAWWEDLEPAWKEIIIQNLDLEDYFELKDLRYIETLNHLDCSGSEILSLQPLLKFPYLTSLNLSDTAVEDFEMLAQLSFLKRLDLSFCRGVDLQHIQSLKKLEVLDLSYPKSSVQHIERIVELTGLVTLKADACRNIQVLRLIKMPHLANLSLRFCYISEMEEMMFQGLKPSCEIKV